MNINISFNEDKFIIKRDTLKYEIESDVKTFTSIDFLAFLYNFDKDDKIINNLSIDSLDNEKKLDINRKYNVLENILKSYLEGILKYYEKQESTS
ncbi:hypothetical protein [Spiroplasma floricola]|uniref:Uncharacterized protein n=1 Tax=Spiroplasma floricola 23-6 TaxID=1336749 RepID=A0A2K8SCU2_9MOLU|nr:hypothetical protein [Spiroplasma floricola]AUB31287.1 hypothetical protein SFLOR_v1c02260 [Spiroplasma floricola 23-6]